MGTGIISWASNGNHKWEGKERKGNISGLFLCLFSSNNETILLQICAGIVIALPSTVLY